MDNEKWAKAIAVLVEKINSLESSIYFKDIDIKNLKEENTRLNELLTPKKKIEQKEGENE